MQGFLKKYNINYFYHFTDKSNLESIKEHGLLSLKLIKEKQLNPIYGGNDWSHDADERIGMDSYVHLSFDMNHPMLYNAKNNGQIKNSIWLKINASILLNPNVKFTNDVANKSGVSDYDISEIETHLDCKTLFSSRPDWSSKEYKKVRRSELLIPNCIPASFIQEV